MDLTKQKQIEEQPKVDASITDDKLRGFLNGHSKLLTPALILFILFYAAVFYYQWYIFLFPVVLFSIIFLVAIYLTKSYFVESGFVRRFAERNGYLYSAEGNPDGLDGYIFQFGVSHTFSDIISGKFNGKNMSFFTFGYRVVSNQSEYNYFVSVFRFDVGSNLPHIFLQNIQHGFVHPIFSELSGLKTLKLEGNFNEFFKLKVEQGCEAEALEAFAPDVMADLEDKSRTFGLEMINNHLYVYKPRLLRNEKELNELYDCAKYFAEKLAPVLERINRS